VVEEFWKGDCDLRFVVYGGYDTSSRLPGSKVGRYWCMWGCGVEQGYPLYGWFSCDWWGGNIKKLIK